MANIALVLLELGLEITSARITTLGERWSVFVVTRADGEHIRDAQQCYNIEQAIRQRWIIANPQNECNRRETTD